MKDVVGGLKIMKSAEDISQQSIKISEKGIRIHSNRYIHRGPNVDYCVVCGEIVPEGTEVCSGCRKKYLEED